MLLTFYPLFVQPQVRAAAVACLNAWHTEIGLASMVEQEFISSALATENPNLRAEVIIAIKILVFTQIQDNYMYMYSVHVWLMYQDCTNRKW